MKMRCVRLGSSLLLSVTIAFGPAVQGADQAVIYLAKAIGEDTPPTAPKQPIKPGVPAKTTPAPQATKPATPPEQPPTGMATKTKVWIGVGVAALLAAAAGGGGGGGGAAPHP